MTLAKAIMATLAYHDVFDYPLTSTQIHSYLISQKADLGTVAKTLEKLVKDAKIGEISGLYFLGGKASLVKLRRGRQKYSEQKLKRAQLFANILKIIPTVKLVAVSGALAMDNSHRQDDIDLVIVSSTDTLWTTRLLSSVILLPFKRDPGGKHIANRACLNLFIDQSHLRISPPNLYLAHEICQMKPLWDREDTYSQFIKANQWIRKFLPNWKPSKVESQRASFSDEKRESKSYPPLTTHQSSLVEKALRVFQLYYMRKRFTTEKIGEGQLFFHPARTQNLVFREYQKRLSKLKINA